MLACLAALALAQSAPTPPPPDAPPGTAILCFGRPSPLGPDVTLEIGGKPLGTLEPGKYARVFAPVGRTTVTVVGPSDKWDDTWQLVAGDRKYVKIATAGPSPKAALKVEEVSVEDNGFAKSCGPAPVLSIP
jgi:hypothetical protein